MSSVNHQSTTSQYKKWLYSLIIGATIPDRQTILLAILSLTTNKTINTAYHYSKPDINILLARVSFSMIAKLFCYMIDGSDISWWTIWGYIYYDLRSESIFGAIQEISRGVYLISCFEIFYHFWNCTSTKCNWLLIYIISSKRWRTLPLGVSDDDRGVNSRASYSLLITIKPPKVPIRISQLQQNNSNSNYLLPCEIPYNTPNP